jgi:uncharacterized protein YegL
MGRFMPMADEEVMSVPGAGTFTFSAKKIEKLGALQYTIVGIAIDVSGSVAGFADQLRKCLISIIEACRENQRAQFLVVRVITFGTDTDEIHGFRELIDIDSTQYPNFNPSGFTCLYDATYDLLGSIIEYSRQMVSKGYDVNGAAYVITDGDENPGHHRTIASPKMIKAKVDEALRKEDIESIITTLIGLRDPNSPWDPQVSKFLENFKDEAGFTKYIDAGEADAHTLAKIADWVSASVSSQSDTVGTNTPSQLPDF